jgi:phospholipid transport system substrate-binding protein
MRLLRGLSAVLAAGLMACMALGFVAGTGAAAADPASTVIEGLNAKFIEVMKNGPKLGYTGRYKEFEPALSAAFDFADMTRVSTGQYWKGLSDADKAQLIEAFRRYSVATYASRFKDFSGERFEVLGEEPALRDSTLVKNQIVTSKGEPVRIDYLMQPGADGGMKVVDVYYKTSVSQLALQRSQFTSVLAKQGIGGLIAALNDKTAAMEKGGDTAAATSN